MRANQKSIVGAGSTGRATCLQLRWHVKKEYGQGGSKHGPIACAKDSLPLWQVLTCSAHSWLTSDTRLARAHCCQTWFFVYPFHSSFKTKFSGSRLGHPARPFSSVHEGLDGPCIGIRAHAPHAPSPSSSRPYPPSKDFILSYRRGSTGTD